MINPVTNPLWRRDGNICPDKDGERIGTYQEFEVYCGEDMPNKDLNRAKADNLTHCIDLCSAHNPYCYGVAFDPQRRDGIQSCWFKSGSSPRLKKKGWQTAILKADRTQSVRDCEDLDATYTSEKGKGDAAKFKTFCDRDMPAVDLRTTAADSLADCIDQCAEVDECKGVAYNADRAISFFNCWLKNTYNESTWVNTGGRTERFFDAAFRLDVVEGDATSSASSSAPSSSSTGTGSADLTTDADTSATAPATSSTSSPANTDDSEDVPVGAIAGGVVGGVAVLALLLGLAFWFWRKRRNSSRGAGMQPINNVAHSPASGSSPPESSHLSYAQVHGQDAKAHSYQQQGYYNYEHDLKGSHYYSPVEMDSQTGAVELSTTREVGELPGSTGR